MKHTCCKCGATAVWCYMPYDERAEADRYYCDKCIPRGCSCNIDFLTEKENLDDQGRKLPCMEYDFNSDGYDK